MSEDGEDEEEGTEEEEEEEAQPEESSKQVNLNKSEFPSQSQLLLETV